MTLEISISDKDLDAIKGCVLNKRGMDLSYFKPAFLARRINVRMKMLNIGSSSEYATLLSTEPDEISSLYDSLSINVTKFYRDKKVWQVFTNIAIPMLREIIKPSDTIRVWSCGCGTGEEAYSLAIMFNEAFKNLDQKFKIMATDINLHALKEARKGIYAYDNLKNLDSLLITKYFKKVSSTEYQIIDKIKDLVSFNLGDITTFPASYLDVVFCRNLLIYYGKDAQDLIFKKFYTVLKPKRFLVLGMDETLWGHKYENSFLPTSSRDRIYQKKPSTESLSENILGDKK
jgi:chemotaxis methyl-accepting protein methylase